MTSTDRAPCKLGPKHHLVVVGMMASGKTTFGAALAAALEAPFVDNDIEIESADTGTGRDIAVRDGVEELHRLEARVLLGHLDRVEPTVIAAAASVVDSPDCRAAMAEHATVCWIDIPVDELDRRVGRGRHRRAMDHSELRRLHARRAPHFADVADIRVNALDPIDGRVRLVVDLLLDRR